LVVEPDFWVPPVIGPWVLKRELRAGGERALYRIERLARGEPTGFDPERRGEVASAN
jgi:hypothetical protein